MTLGKAWLTICTVQVSGLFNTIRGLPSFSELRCM